MREVEYLKKTLEREAELHKIEMLKLQKEFLIKTQHFENELKKQEDELSEDEKVNEIDTDQRMKSTNEWANQVPRFNPEMKERTPYVQNRNHHD